MMNNKEQLSFKLENLGADTIRIFTAACKYGSTLNNVEIVSIDEVELPEGIIKKGFNINLRATIEDVFWVGRFFERLDRLRTIELMRFKKSVKVKVPEQLILLCDLLEVSPEQVLQAFANDLSLTVHGSSGSDERHMAVDYFIRCGHGMGLYEPEQLDSIFGELDWLRKEWNSFGNPGEKEYGKFFKTQLNLWYNKWKELKALNQETN